MMIKIRHLFLIVFVTGLVIGCGPSEEEQRQREQARQDSLEQVRQDSLARVQQQRQDSLARVRQDSIQAQQQNKVSFSKSGHFTIQVGSWRSEVKAQQQADMWKERGYNNAFVVQYGNEDTGDVWFRVRLGRVDSRDAAQKLQESLQQEYQEQSWISVAE